jgi:hypothetical protein
MQDTVTPSCSDMYTFSYDRKYKPKWVKTMSLSHDCMKYVYHTEGLRTTISLGDTLIR